MSKSFVKGFMGKTHALLSVMLLCICMLIPVEFLKDSVWLLKDNVLFFIVGITVTVGGALLPDLDNCQSSAGSTLGPIGSLCTTFMQTTSTIIWTFMHTKRERRPPTPHRYLWHTPIIGIGLICLFFFGIENSDSTIIQSIQSEYIAVFLANNVALLVFLIILFMSVLVGSNMIMYRVIKLFKLPKILKYIFPVAVLVYVFMISYSQLKILGICIGLGYLFHCLEDVFADSGVPLFWPIPIQGQFWKKRRFLITCETGGLVNTVVDMLALVIDIGLIIFIIIQKGGA